MNFLNSPGALILRELGIGGSRSPWNQMGAVDKGVGQTGGMMKDAAPGQSSMDPATGAAAGPMAMGGVPQIAPAQIGELPYKRPQGFFNRVMQAFMGGGFG